LLDANYSNPCGQLTKQIDGEHFERKKCIRATEPGFAKRFFVGKTLGNFTIFQLKKLNSTYWSNKMKKLSIVMLSLICAPAIAGDLNKSMSASNEAEFLNSAGSEWTKVGVARYQSLDAKGRQVTVGFGEDALINDLAYLAELTASLEVKLKAATKEFEKAQIRNSLAETKAAYRSIENSQSNQAKISQTGFANLQGCNNNIAIQAYFDSFMVGSLTASGVTVEAYGPSFVPFSVPVGTVTLIANTNNGVNIDTDTQLMSTSYVGEYLSSSSSAYDWGCTLEARASIVPSCPTAGYRSVSWATNCNSTVVGQLPATFSNYRKR
jgi:hypothetical protein